jgi:hypothetical protein
VDNLETYYEKLALQSKAVRTDALSDIRKVSYAHARIEAIATWHEMLRPRPEMLCLSYTIQELQLSLYAVVNGLYASAYAALRLSLELAFAAVYFSANRLNLEEWRTGRWDLTWGCLSHADNGVLSGRYINAFFPQLEHLRGEVALSSAIYRELSEFVHGNLKTLVITPEAIAFDDDLHGNYFKLFGRVSYLINVALGVRYLRELEKAKLEKMEGYVLEELGHISAFRQVFEEAK